MWTGSQIYYNYYLRWLGIEFAYLEWNPGSIEYYGNPALDVGDSKRKSICI